MRIHRITWKRPDLNRCEMAEARTIIQAQANVAWITTSYRPDFTVDWHIGYLNK